MQPVLLFRMDGQVYENTGEVKELVDQYHHQALIANTTSSLGCLTLGLSCSGAFFSPLACLLPAAMTANFFRISRTDYEDMNSAVNQIRTLIRERGIEPYVPVDRSAPIRALEIVRPDGYYVGPLDFQE